MRASCDSCISFGLLCIYDALLPLRNVAYVYIYRSRNGVTMSVASRSLVATHTLRALINFFFLFVVASSFLGNSALFSVFSDRICRFFSHLCFFLVFSCNSLGNIECLSSLSINRCCCTVCGTNKRVVLLSLFFPGMFNSIIHANSTCETFIDTVQRFFRILHCIPTQRRARLAPHSWANEIRRKPSAEMFFPSSVI